MGPNPNVPDDDQNTDEFDPNFFERFFSGPDDEDDVPYPADYSSAEDAKAMLRILLPTEEHDALPRLYELMSTLEQATPVPDEAEPNAIPPAIDDLLNHLGVKERPADTPSQVRAVLEGMGFFVPSSPDDRLPQKTDLDKDKLAEIRRTYETDPDQAFRDFVEMVGPDDANVGYYFVQHVSREMPKVNLRKIRNHYVTQMAQYAKDGYRMPDEDDLPSDDELNQFIKRKLVELERLPHRSMYIISNGMRMPWWRRLEIHVSYDERRYQKVEASGQGDLVRKELAAALVGRFPILESRIIDITLSGE